MLGSAGIPQAGRNALLDARAILVRARDDLLRQQQEERQREQQKQSNCKFEQSLLHHAHRQRAGWGCCLNPAKHKASVMLGHSRCRITIQWVT